MDDPNAVKTGAEPVGADLRHNCLDPLTDRGGARDHLDDPIAAERDAHIVEWPEPAFLDEEAKSQANHLACLPTPGGIDTESLPLDPVQELVEQAGIVAGIVNDLGAEGGEFAPERHRVLRNKVPMPDCNRIEPEPVGDDVDEPFAHEARLETSWRAISTARRLIRQAHVPDRPVGRNYEGAREHRASEVGDDDAVRPKVAPLVEPEFVVQAKDKAVLVHCGAYPMERAPRLVGRHQMLVAVLDPLDRPSEPQRRGANQNILGIQLAANAKPAADMPFVEMNPIERQTEHRRQRLAVVMRHLGRAIQPKNAAARFRHG